MMVRKIALVCALFFLASFGVGPTQADPDLRQMEVDALNVLNQDRAERVLPTLIMQPQLRAAAQGHSTDMAEHDFLSHIGSDGSSPGQRVARQNYPGSYFGEVAAGGHNSGYDVIKAWEGNPNHANILFSPVPDEVGFGVDFREGTTFGFYWTANLGRGTGVAPTNTVPPPNTPTTEPYPPPPTSRPTATAVPPPNTPTATAEPTATATEEQRARLSIRLDASALSGGSQTMGEIRVENVGNLGRMAILVSFDQNLLEVVDLQTTLPPSFAVSDRLADNQRGRIIIGAAAIGAGISAGEDGTPLATFAIQTKNAERESSVWFYFLASGTTLATPWGELIPILTQGAALRLLPGTATATPSLTSAPTVAATATLTAAPTSTPSKTATPTASATAPQTTVTGTPTATDTPKPPPTEVPTPTPKPTAKTQSAVLRPEPLVVKVNQGGEGDFAIVVENVSDLFAVDLDIAIDPNILEIVDADPLYPGVQISRGEMFLGVETIAVINTADNDTGKIRYVFTVICRPGQSCSGVSGTGSIAVVKIRGREVGTGRIRFLDRTLLNDSKARNIIARLVQEGEIRVGCILFLPLLGR